MPAPTDSVEIPAIPTSVVTAAGTDIFPVSQGGVTKQETLAQALTWIQTQVAPVAAGGTGIASYTIGDLLYASGAATLSKLADVATGNALISGGVGVAPAWGKIDLTAHVSGILPSANGGTGVNNAGTITNASNTTITGGGTLALGGFTLTVPATGTAVLLAIANVFTAAQTAQRDAIGASTTDGLILTNATAAAAGAQQWSPRLRFTGQGWKTNAAAASQTVDWIVETLPVQGAAAPTSALVFSAQINGGGYTERMRLDSTGLMTITPTAGGLTIFGSSANVVAVVSTTATAVRGTSGGSGTGIEGLNTSTGLGAAFLYNGSAAAAVQTIQSIDNNGSNGGTNAGARLVFRTRTSTTATVDQADWTSLWVVGTHASRTARLTGNVFDTAAREWIRAEASGTAAMVGFLGASAVVRQTGGENLTNSVTSGGTDGTIANYTDLTVYATDAAAIRNNIYQLARMLKQDHDALRLYGFLT